ncbi:MAG: response regulator [bacterium]
MKILIVEDEDILVRVLREKFEDNGFDVEVAEEGDKVIPLVEKFKPDMILLDIFLPKLNGMDILEKLKDDEVMKTIPVIIISNLDDDKKIKEALNLGAVDYIVKSQHPINEVVELVNKYILKAK